MPELEQTVSPMSRLAYLTYDDMLQKIQTKEIDEYDIVFSRDHLVTYLISENLEPIEIHSRVYIFNSIEEAEIKLNGATDTYVGQIVSILYDDTYRGYIVNQKDNRYIVIPLWEHPEPIDYNTLGNQPITNLIGTLDEPIIVSELGTGLYSIKGQYKIYESEITTYSTGCEVIFIVDKNEDSIKIKKITSNDIIDYLISENTVISNKYITNDFLKDYATTDYVDKKIEALQKSITEDIKTYVEKVVKEQFGTILDEKIESKISEMLIPVDDSDIEKLF